MASPFDLRSKLSTKDCVVGSSGPTNVSLVMGLAVGLSLRKSRKPTKSALDDRQGFSLVPSLPACTMRKLADPGCSGLSLSLGGGAAICGMIAVGPSSLKILL